MNICSEEARLVYVRNVILWKWGENIHDKSKTNISAARVIKIDPRTTLIYLCQAEAALILTNTRSIELTLRNASYLNLSSHQPTSLT